MEKDFGKFLSERRKEVGLTQKQLGEKLFLSESTISKWEKNKANPDISMISDLSKILKVSEHELINASIDKKERAKTKDAKKWNILTSIYNNFFIYSYAIAILVCFIVNIATLKTLSWFWVVLLSLVFSASFTTVPKYIQTKKVLFVPLIQLVSLLMLLAVCSIYSHGYWFLMAAIPVVVGFVIVFLPIYIKDFKFPYFIKFNNALISFIVDVCMVLLMLKYFNFKFNGSWFEIIALPITLYCSIIPLFFILICQYVKISRLYKTSILVAIFIPFLIFGYQLAECICLKKNIEISKILFPNFSNWSNETYVNSNTYAIILIVLTIISLSFLILGIVNSIKKNKKSK